MTMNRQVKEQRQMGKTKPILCFDFDGVIHSYTSGWKGPRKIPDPPVSGALEYLVTALDHFEVHIFSSRSKYIGGRWAMKRWLARHYREMAPNWDESPVWLREVIAKTAFADPWKDEVRWAIKGLLKEIKFPKYKPPAMVTLDDRALTFTGKWPMIQELETFKPWYKRDKRDRELAKGVDFSAMPTREWTTKDVER
jgi:hypothetical protein